MSAQDPEARPRQKAAQLINDYIHELSEPTVNAMRKIIAELEFADQQTGGVEFQDLTFDAALKVAGEQGKLIFLDAFTTWCGPCRSTWKKVKDLV